MHTTDTTAKRVRQMKPSKRCYDLIKEHSITCPQFIAILEFASLPPGDSARGKYSSLAYDWRVIKELTREAARIGCTSANFLGGQRHTRLRWRPERMIWAFNSDYDDADEMYRKDAIAVLHHAMQHNRYSPRQGYKRNRAAQ